MRESLSCFLVKDTEYIEGYGEIEDKLPIEIEVIETLRAMMAKGTMQFSNVSGNSSDAIATNDSFIAVEMSAISMIEEIQKRIEELEKM